MLLPDGALAVCVMGVAIAGTHWAAMWQQPGFRPVDTLGFALIAAAAAPLAVRRTWPLPTLAATVGAVVVYLALRYPYGPVFLGPVIAVYTVGAHLPLPRSLGLAALATLALSLPGALGAPDPVAAAQFIAWHAIWLLGPWGIGAALRFHRMSVARDLDAESRRRAYEQRLEVAREVHDVVGHGLAVINMQAGVALHVLDRRPEQARVALEAIRQASKESLDEVRATLAVFRQSDARRAEPGLDQLEGLVAAMAERGLPVELVVSGQPAGLSAAVDLAAYRIVQESLTNVVRHAGASRATVRVAYEPERVLVEVTDDGRTRAGSWRRPGGGHGIAGMRERASALGGELAAGPRPEGGFRVLARLPAGAAS
jgi:signal transduction histidine kinase